MPRPILATVHSAALRHNLACLRAHAPRAKCLAVLKADAYGHGITHVYSALQHTDGFAVLDLAEAKRIRALGYCGPILLLEGVFTADDLALCSQLRLWHTVHENRQIDWLAAANTDTTHHVFLKLNSGMHRLGFAPVHYRRAYIRLQALPQVRDITHMLHFANADQPDGIQAAMHSFAQATQGLPGATSLCNSAGLLLHAHNTSVCGDWLRPGISLYGSSPDYPNHSIADWGLKPTMSLSSRVIATQAVCAGQGVGYGFTFHAERDLTIGIVACGYADGYPRHAPSGTPILVQGQRTRLLGRVSMDMLAVDLNHLQHLPQEGLGAEVCLWGYAQNGAILGVDEVAHAAGTIAHELLTGIGTRVPFSLDDVLTMPITPS